MADSRTKAESIQNEPRISYSTRKLKSTQNEYINPQRREYVKEAKWKSFQEPKLEQFEWQNKFSSIGLYPKYEINIHESNTNINEWLNK